MFGRSDDLIVVICQNNDNKSLVIESVDNSRASLNDIIGYHVDEVLTKDFRDLLTIRIKNILTEYIEFSEDGADFVEVLSKVTDFQMVTKSGEEVVVDIKLQRDVSMDDNARFMLVMRRQPNLIKDSDRILGELKLEEVINEETGLGDEESFLKKAEILKTYLKQGNIEASFAIIEIDDIDEIIRNHGMSNLNKIVKHVSDTCNQAFRSADVLGSLDTGKFGIVLLDAGQAGARIPLNRLRSQIASQPIPLSDDQEENITLSIAFKEISEEESIVKTIANCDLALEQNQDQTNKLLTA